MSDINITVNDEIVNIDVLDTPVYVEVTNSPGPAGAGVAAGGTTGQVLAKASNTNYDTVWVNASSGGVPYIGATGNVDLGTHTILAQNATIASSGSGDTATITHSSGSGIALNITKGGNGEGLYVNKTGGSGNAATILGTLNATTIVKSGGTSSQFLKADGTTDSTAYVPTTRLITINGVSYDLSADRTWTISAGISGTIATGQVAYATAANTIGGSNNLFWDNANSRLGIGTNAPTNDITINKSFDGPVRLRIDNTSTGGNALTDIYIRNSTGGATFQITGTGNTIPSVIANQARFRTDIAVTNGFTFLTGTTAPITFGTNDIVGMTMFGSTRNFVLQNGGTFTDAGQRLQVYGDTLLRGSGATSATTALTVQNSSSTNLFSVRNDGLSTVNKILSSTGTESQGTLISGSASTRYTSFTGVNTSAVYANSATTGADVWVSYVGGSATSNIYTYFQSSGYIGTRGGLRLGASSGTDVITSITNTWLNIASGNTTRSQINLASGTAPTSPNDGDIWFDGTDIKMRIGGVTKTFTLV